MPNVHVIIERKKDIKMQVEDFKSPISTNNTLIRVSMPEENPESFIFKMHKFQGSCEKGTEGYQELIALEQSIIKTIDYMNENHKEFTIEQAKRYISTKIPENSVKPLITQDDIDDGDLDFNKNITQRTTDILESDEIAVSHHSTISRLSPERNLDVENMKIHVGKWQGDNTEKGAEGLYRLMVMRDAISKAKRVINMAFEGIDNKIEQRLDNEEELSI